MPRGSDSRVSKKIRRPSATSVGSGAKRAVAASILPATCGVPLPTTPTTRDGGAPGSRTVSEGGAALAVSASPASVAAAHPSSMRFRRARAGPEVPPGAGAAARPAEAAEAAAGADISNGTAPAIAAETRAESVSDFVTAAHRSRPCAGRCAYRTSSITVQ